MPAPPRQYQKCDNERGWVVEFLDDRVLSELRELPAGMRARFNRIVDLIEKHGLQRLFEPHVKHLEGPLWEMRTRREIELAWARAQTVVRS